MVGWRMGTRLGILAVGLALLVGCGQTGMGSVPATGQTGQAAVQSLEVLEVVSQQPGELRAVVQGTLPDSCTQLADPVISRAGNLVVVILEQEPASGAKNCASAPRPFERIITLGQNMQPGHYTVSVNGVQTIFDFQGAAVAAAKPAAAAQPAAAPTAVAAAAAAQPAAALTPTAVPPMAVPPTATAAAPTVQPTAPAVAQSSAPQPTTAAQPPAPQTNVASQPAQAPVTGQASTGGQGAECDNKAAFFADLSIPDGTIFDPGQAFSKSWRVRNAGTCSWSGYSLTFKDGDPLGAQNSIPLAGKIAPGDTVDITIKMTAPQKPGGYYSDWLLSAGDGATFGLGAAKDGLLWTKIGVRTVLPVTGGLNNCAYQTDPTVEAQILDMINQARDDRNLAPLKLNEKLNAAARAHSEDMACNDFVEHYGSDGSTWYGRIQAQSVKYKSASENIYAGDPKFGGTALGAFTWWMNSQIHRDNILAPKSSQIGIGYIYYDGSTYKGYYTLDFIVP